MKAQSLPHFGVKAQLTRRGKMVTGEAIGLNGGKEFTSIRRARRYMRTGSPERAK